MGSNVYMFWIIIAIFGPLFHTLVNILDNYFVNRIFKHTATLIFYSYLVNLLFLPLIFVFKMPQIPTLTMIHFFENAPLLFHDLAVLQFYRMPITNPAHNHCLGNSYQ